MNIQHTYLSAAHSKIYLSIYIYILYAQRNVYEPFKDPKRDSYLL